MKKIMFLLLTMTGMLFVGCTPRVATQVTMPAKSQEASEIKNVAVFPFEGNFGKQATVEIENVLASAEVDGKKYFTVVDRQNIQKLMSEQKLQTSGVIDQRTAVKLGKLIGANGVYIGTADFVSNDENYSEGRSKCVASDSKGRCVSYSNYSVSCVKRSVGLSILPKLIDIATGQVKYSNKLGGSESSKRCSDSSRPLDSSEELAGTVNKLAMDQFRKDVAPYNMTVMIEIMEKTDGIPDNDGKENLKYSVAFAKNGRLDRACEVWKKGEVQYPQSLSFVYNVGICYESEGNLDAALEQYNKSDKLTMKPEDAINNALFRVRQRIENNKKLSSQMK